MAELISINVGRPEIILPHKAPTGINKQAVPSAQVTTLGVVGDAVLDKKHHGGPDQAVYIYFADDYAFWEAELGKHLRPGQFGENLTISGIDSADIAVGDHFAIGDVLLEVTMHRTPCNTFAAQMGDRKWVKQFARALRPGAYARVLAEGTVHPGDVVSYEPFAGPKVRVSDLMALDGRRDLDADTLRWALSAPIHHRRRDTYEARLAELGAGRE
jgi:MOSC domain-containing protein YiiM